MSWKRGIVGLIVFLVTLTIIGAARVHMQIPEPPMWYDFAQNAAGALLYMVLYEKVPSHG